jgi:YD repeat-containing protein
MTFAVGRVVNQGYNAVGRLTQIADATNYLSGMTYNSASQPTGFNYGNGVAASFGYNSRLQLSTLRYYVGGWPTHWASKELKLKTNP